MERNTDYESGGVKEKGHSSVSCNKKGHETNMKRGGVGEGGIL